jgi:deoxyribose-phosphate aldolase
MEQLINIAGIMVAPPKDEIIVESTRLLFESTVEASLLRLEAHARMVKTSAAGQEKVEDITFEEIFGDTPPTKETVMSVFQGLKDIVSPRIEI